MLCLTVPGRNGNDQALVLAGFDSFHRPAKQFMHAARAIKSARWIVWIARVWHGVVDEGAKIVVSLARLKQSLRNKSLTLLHASIAEVKCPFVSSHQRTSLSLRPGQSTEQQDQHQRSNQTMISCRLASRLQRRGQRICPARCELG